MPQSEDGSAGPYAQYARADSLPELYDMPIGLVNRVLYDRPPT